MNCYSEIAKLIPEFMTVANDIRKNRLPMGVTGLSHIHKAHVIASLCMALVRRAAVVMPDEAQATRMKQDLEGLQTMRTLGRNMAWMLKCIEAGKKSGINFPEHEEKVATNFIR